MLRFRLHRAASLIVTFLGTSVNFIIAAQLLSSWRSFKWEPESEWEMLGDRWRVDGVKVGWVLLSTYFASAAAISAVGLAGVIKNKASLVRFYRDYSIADFSFCTSFAVLAVYAASNASTRAGICEELSRHPELMRDMLEMGMNVENCELWLERAVLALAALLFTVIVIRLHFLLAVASYYTQLSRYSRPCYLPSCDGIPQSRSHSRQDSKRIYLLPTSLELSSSRRADVEVVYAPVPMNQLSSDQRSQAKEAWVSETMPSNEQSQHSQTHQHAKHHHHHHHSRRQSRSGSASDRDKAGTIYLPIQPGEGLLPGYSADVKQQLAKA
ncbi:hypothetical protein AX17_002161 [Amanita inopinata Kibby_2008]|nr:hypothetical protein AX17_002161 [Amanita inopinata Kibby_2008]